jgi:hypothetical protein
MKGSKGPSGSVGQAEGMAPRLGDEGAESGQEKSRPVGQPLETAKRPSGELTPSIGKKVITLKPDVDTSSRQKERGRKRFKITISFSERTYERLSRLSRKKEKGGGTATALQPGESPIVAEPVGRGTGAGPHGRARLKAVRATPRRPRKERGFTGRVLGHRDRPWDRRDWTTALAYTACGILVLILTFMSWMRLGWIDENGADRTVDIKGIQLGFPVYIIMAIVLVAWLYMAMTWLLGKPLVDLDFGVVLLVAGVLIIIIFYITLSWSGLVVRAADRALGWEEGMFKEVVSGYDQRNIWPAYLMILMACGIAFSGLARLSERRSVSIVKQSDIKE